MMKWTEEELQFLRDNYATMNKKEMANILNRKIDAVRMKAHVLGIDSHRYYSQEEEDYIEENFGRLTIKAIAKNLNRPFYSVKSKVSKMGLGRYIDNTDSIHVREVARMLNLPHSRICYWENYGLKIQKRGKYSLITQDNLAAFLKEHFDLWDATECESWYFERYSWFHEKLLNDRKRRYDKVC